MTLYKVEAFRDNAWTAIRTAVSAIEAESIRAISAVQGEAVRICPDVGESDDTDDSE